MDGAPLLLAFALDDQRYALHLSAVERVVRIVELTRLPDAPEIVAGVVNVAGKVIPVLDIRRRFHLPEREATLNDHLVIARTARRAVALIVEAALGVVECAQQDVVKAPQILPGTRLVEGVVKLGDGMLLIHDLDDFLSLEEEQTLDDAMAHA
jgi:purine-binding chemotaxis protein CheW